MNWKHASDAELWQLFRMVATAAGDEFWNVTKLCSLFGRRFEDYRTDHDPPDELLFNTDAGVFARRKVAQSVLLWCSPRLNVLFVNVIDDLLFKGMPGIPKEHAEASLEQDCPEMFKVLVEPGLG